MPRETTVDGCSLDLSQLEFGDIKHYEKSKLPYVPVTFNGGTLLVRTPELAMPFGVSSFVPEGKTEGEKNIDLSFRDATGDAEVFRQKMVELDRMVLDVSHQRSKEWFGKQKSRDTLDDNHNKIVKLGKKEEYGMSMKVKWPKVMRPEQEPTFWNAARKQVDESECISNSKGCVIVELRPLYMVQGKYGIKFTVRQVMITEKPERLTGCGFGPAADGQNDVIKGGEEEDDDEYLED